VDMADMADMVDMAVGIKSDITSILTTI